MRTAISRILCLLFVSSAFYSCRKDLERPYWDVDVLAPLVNSSLDINQVITDSLIQLNPDNSLSIFYSTELGAMNNDSLFKIPDTVIVNTFPSPFSYPAGPGGVVVPLFSNPIKYDLGDAQLTKLIIRSGIMQITLKSQLKGKVDFSYTLPGVTDAKGNVFDTTIIVPAATVSGDGVYTGSFDLSGYTVDLRGATGIDYNTVVTTYSASASMTNTDTIHIVAGEIVELQNRFISIVPEFARGYFGNQATSFGPDTSAFTLFNRILDGSIGLESTDINLSFENSIGVDARLSLKSLASRNSKTGNSVSLSSSILNTPINITRAQDQNGTVIPSVTKVSLNNANSNIKSLIENLPNQMSYQIDLNVNPLGNVSGGNDFLYYDHLLKTKLNITIPLSVVANNLTLADTVSYEFNTAGDNLNHGYLYLDTWNGFPFTAYAQIYLADSNMKVLDSLILSPNSIPAPQLDGYGVCVGQKYSRLRIFLSDSKLAVLSSNKNMIIKMRFNTTNNPSYVKIFNHYRLDVKLIADVNYTLGG